MGDKKIAKGVEEIKTCDALTVETFKLLQGTDWAVPMMEPLPEEVLADGVDMDTFSKAKQAQKRLSDDEIAQIGCARFFEKVEAPKDVGKDDKVLGESSGGGGGGGSRSVYRRCHAAAIPVEEDGKQIVLREAKQLHGQNLKK